MTWDPGTSVVIRERWGQSIWSVRPATVVKDTRSEKIFYVPIGARWMFPADEDGNELRLPTEDWTLARGEMNTRHILSFAWPRWHYAVLLAWDHDWNFTGYYVNLQTPLERTPVGFDTTDHVLDVEISPDRETVRWKDEDELALMVELGEFTPEDAERFRRWGQDAIDHVRYETPFDRDWSTWRPDPDWPFPELPEDWDSLEN